MAITHVREGVPTGLPVARLLLDDIKAIKELLSEELKKLADTPDSPVWVTYRINRDTQCEDIADLKEIGGYVKDFEMDVAVKLDHEVYSARLKVGGRSNYLWIFGNREELAWTLHGRVQRVFFARRLKSSYVYESLPTAMQQLMDMLAASSGTIVLMIVFSWLRALVRHTHVSPATLPASGALALLALLVGLGSLRKSGVYLHYRHDIHRERRAERRTWIRDVVKLVIGAVLGVVGTLLTRIFIQKY